jgi:hypothetical protein
MDSFSIIYKVLLLIGLVFFITYLYDFIIVSLTHKAYVNKQNERQFKLISFVIFPFVLDKHNKAWYYFFKGISCYFKDNYVLAAYCLEKCIKNPNFNTDNYSVYIFLIKSLKILDRKDKAFNIFNKFNSILKDNEMTKLDYFKKTYNEFQEYFNVKS